MEKIPATVGILTFNSGKTLARCLESVKDFAQILIADGGSTDETLEIAKHYGAHVIKQSNPGHAITDFGLERNRLLDATTQDWFFYLDSDETMSPELRDGIAKVARDTHHAFFVYQVRYMLTNPDLSVKYRTAVPYYQPRFFSTKIGARFIKKVHEKIQWDKVKYRTGKLEGAWYVPLDVQLDFKVYKAKVDHRLPLMIAEWNPSFFGAIQKGIFEPIFTTIKHILKVVYLHIHYSSKELVPLKYDIFRMYSQWVIAKSVWARYFRKT